MNEDKEITINLKNLRPIGNNLYADVVGDHMILVLDITKTIGLSSTGKMMGIASTEGFALMPNGTKGNVYIGRRA